MRASGRLSHSSDRPRAGTLELVGPPGQGPVLPIQRWYPIHSAMATMITASCFIQFLRMATSTVTPMNR